MVSSADSAFWRLRESFTSAPILRLPDPQLQFILEVDASDASIGAVLQQRSSEQDKLHPCTFLSGEKLWCREPRVVGSQSGPGRVATLARGGSAQVFVWTDHKNLENIRMAKCLKARQARWAFFFNGLYFTLSDRPDSKNTIPDALFRLPDPDFIIALSGRVLTLSSDRGTNQPSRPLKMVGFVKDCTFNLVQTVDLLDRISNHGKGHYAWPLSDFVLYISFPIQPQMIHSLFSLVIRWIYRKQADAQNSNYLWLPVFCSSPFICHCQCGCLVSFRKQTTIVSR